MVNVKGKIYFSKSIGRLPSNSCIQIKLQDASQTGAKPMVLQYKKINASGLTITDSFPYSIWSKKPNILRLNRNYIITAILNKGWCPEDGSFPWIKKYDYLDTKQHTIKMNYNRATIKKDISLECYGECMLYTKSKYFFPLFMGSLDVDAL